VNGAHDLQCDGNRQQVAVKYLLRAQVHHDAAVGGDGVAGRKRELPGDGLGGVPGAAGADHDLTAVRMAVPSARRTPGEIVLSPPTSVPSTSTKSARICGRAANTASVSSAFMMISIPGNAMGFRRKTPCRCGTWRQE